MFSVEERRFRQSTTEAANRAEATAVLIRCRYRVYRPEADIHGEDLVLQTEEGEFRSVQLKSSAVVDWFRYGERRIWMLFPHPVRWEPEATRRWFLTPHDELYDWVKSRHGNTPKWKDRWVYPYLTKAVLDFLTSRNRELLPTVMAHDDRFLATSEGAQFYDSDGNKIDPLDRLDQHLD